MMQNITDLCIIYQLYLSAIFKSAETYHYVLYTTDNKISSQVLKYMYIIDRFKINQ